MPENIDEVMVVVRTSLHAKNEFQFKNSAYCTPKWRWGDNRQMV